MSKKTVAIVLIAGLVAGAAAGVVLRWALAQVDLESILAGPTPTTTAEPPLPTFPPEWLTPTATPSGNRPPGLEARAPQDGDPQPADSSPEGQNNESQVEDHGDLTVTTHPNGEIVVTVKNPQKPDPSEIWVWHLTVAALGLFCLVVLAVVLLRNRGATAAVTGIVLIALVVARGAEAAQENQCTAAVRAGFDLGLKLIQISDETGGTWAYTTTGTTADINAPPSAYVKITDESVRLGGFKNASEMETVLRDGGWTQNGNGWWYYKNWHQHPCWGPPPNRPPGLREWTIIVIVVVVLVLAALVAMLLVQSLLRRSPGQLPVAGTVGLLLIVVLAALLATAEAAHAATVQPTATTQENLWDQIVSIAIAGFVIVGATAFVASVIAGYLRKRAYSQVFLYLTVLCGIGLLVTAAVVGLAKQGPSMLDWLYRWFGWGQAPVGKVMAKIALNPPPPTDDSWLIMIPITIIVLAIALFAILWEYHRRQTTRHLA